MPPAAELTSGWRGNCGEALRGMGRVGTLAHGKQSAYLYQGAHARFTKFKTKLVFTFGIYLFVWRHQVASWLRDDFKAPLDPGHQVLSMFIPIYSLIVLWRFLQTIKATQLQTGMVSAISPARAFWWSSLWFSAGPYTNGQLNALATFAQGKASPTLAAPGPMAPLQARS